MITEFLKIDADNPEPEKIDKAAQAIIRGGIVAVPTETVYGLAANARDQKALKRLYDVKGRQETKPFTIQISDLSQLKLYKRSLRPEEDALLKRFWPGPLTVILETDNGKVGLRMPDNKVTLSIIRQARVPLAVTSANISGKEAAVSAQDVMRVFDTKIEMIVDDQMPAGGIESTVLDCSMNPFKIVRNGAIAAELKEYIDDDN